MDLQDIAMGIVGAVIIWLLVGYNVIDLLLESDDKPNGVRLRKAFKTVRLSRYIIGLFIWPVVVYFLAKEQKSGRNKDIQ